MIEMNFKRKKLEHIPVECHDMQTDEERQLSKRKKECILSRVWFWLYRLKRSHSDERVRSTIWGLAELFAFLVSCCICSLSFSCPQEEKAKRAEGIRGCV